MRNYGYTETNLPKGAQEELDDLRKQVIRLREAQAGQALTYVMRLDNDYFVIPGPQEGQPSVRLWMLTPTGPQMIGVLEHGRSLMMQQVKEEPSE